MKPIFFLVFLLFTTKVFSQSDLFYDYAYSKLDSMLTEQIPLSFKEAVFYTENAFLEGNIYPEIFLDRIDGLKRIAEKIIAENKLDYKYKDKEEVSKYAALYHLMTTEVPVIIGSDTLRSMPFLYDFDGIFGDKDWKQIFISKLLRTNKGNCHSLPYLYKILADEIGAEAHLALAPNHVYIKHRCEKAGWYNTELTSASFPIDAWLMASGYIHLDAIRNGIYMKALDDQESIAMCVIDLAMGYDRKYPGNDGSFALQCCELALKHFPNYINALLLQAETKQRQVRQLMKQNHVDQSAALFRLMPDAESTWKEMESIYFSIHKLGYRQMPKQMYVDWLVSLKEEREKYENRKVTSFGEK